MFLLFPILVVIWLSLHRWDLLTPIRYVGLANWADVLTDPTFGNSMYRTVIFVVSVIPLQTVLGLFLAVLLSRGLPGSACRGDLRDPVDLCAAGSRGGLEVDFRPDRRGPERPDRARVEWLSDLPLALPGGRRGAVWSQVGYVTLFYVAGLPGMPERPAGRRPGRRGGGLRRLLADHPAATAADHLRSSSPPATINAFQVFDTVYAMTAGGPGSPGTPTSSPGGSSTWPSRPARHGPGSALSSS